MSTSFALTAVACLTLGCRFHFDDVSATADGAAGDGDAAGGGGDLHVRVLGWGAITGPGGIACADDCTYAVSGPVTLGVVAGEAWAFDHFDAPCGTQPTCEGDSGQTITATFAQLPITANRVFVTSVPPTLSAGGRNVLDNFCAARATAGGLTGNFIALVSTSSGDAVDRLAGSRGWVRLDGLPVFDQRTELGLDSMPRGIELDELLGRQRAAWVMTGSDGSGRAVAGEMCNDWTSGGATARDGESDSAAFWSITGSTTTCDGLIYCFETGKTVPVTVTPPAFPVGRYVFMSSFFDGTSGIAGADALCQSDAIAASLPGTYKALLATTTESALDHVGSLAGAWRRPDGASVTRTGLDTGGYSTMLAMTWDGMQTAVPPGLGAGSLTSVASTLAWSCNDYTTSSGGSFRVVEAQRMSPFDGTLSNVVGVCGSRPVICVQTQ